MPKKTPDDLITQSEAAKLRKVSVSAINELIKRGRITPHEVVGKIVVSRSEVLAFEPKTHKKRATKKRAEKGSKK
jgi:hypothetical protein